MTEDFAAEKKQASAWFRQLRDDIVAAFEGLEDSHKDNAAPAGRFEVSETKRHSDATTPNVSSSSNTNGENNQSYGFGDRGPLPRKNHTTLFDVLLFRCNRLILRMLSFWSPPTEVFRYSFL